MQQLILEARKLRALVGRLPHTCEPRQGLSHQRPPIGAGAHRRFHDHGLRLSHVYGSRSASACRPAAFQGRGGQRHLWRSAGAVADAQGCDAALKPRAGAKRSGHLPRAGLSLLVALLGQIRTAHTSPGASIGQCLQCTYAPGEAGMPPGSFADVKKKPTRGSNRLTCQNPVLSYSQAIPFKILLSMHHMKPTQQLLNGSRWFKCDSLPGVMMQT